MLIFPAIVSCVPEPLAKGALDRRGRALQGLVFCRPTVATPVHGLRCYGIHLGCSAGAGDGSLAGVVVLTELQQVIASEVIGLESPEELLLSGLRH